MNGRHIRCLLDAPTVLIATPIKVIYIAITGIKYTPDTLEKFLAAQDLASREVLVILESR